MNRNLTATQNDYAVFLPATSGFYAAFIGKQRYEEYVDPARIPASYKAGVESLNYLEPEKGEFHYRWCLYSAGHANLDLDKVDETEDMFRNRDRSTSWVLGDSGGFQIGKGVWEGEWRDPNSAEVQAKMAECVAKGIELIPVLDKDGNPIINKKGVAKTTKIDHVKLYQAKLDAAQKKREHVLRWMDELMDYGMCLDIPAWVERSPAGREATGITSYEEAVEATLYNNEYFINNRNGNCKFLNVLQGENHKDAEDWYNRMKKFCDPTVYGDRAFNGWAMGGQNMCDLELVLIRLVTLRFDGLLEEGKQDWMHFLGTSKLEWACVLTDIQRAVRKYHNPNFTISYDCASPFLATANGQVYINTEIEDRTKWVYRMVPSVDDKKYAQDTRLFKDVVVDDGIFNIFEESPLSDRIEIKDVCIYGQGVPNWTEVNADKISHFDLFREPKYLNDPKYWITMGDANKANKVGRTSWDSFSYAILMGHNVWSHINAVQRANDAYDNNIVPNMLVKEEFVTVYVRDIIDSVFATDDRETALQIIDDHKKLWMRVIGTRGNTGKRLINTSAQYNTHYHKDEPSMVVVEETKKVSKLNNIFNDLFFIEEEILQIDDYEFTEEQEDILSNLEESIKYEKNV